MGGLRGAARQLGNGSSLTLELKEASDGGWPPLLHFRGTEGGVQSGGLVPGHTGHGVAPGLWRDGAGCFGRRLRCGGWEQLTPSFPFLGRSSSSHLNEDRLRTQA